MITPVRVTRELLDRLPKTDLHVHLDGSLRPETMLELAEAQGKRLPVRDAEALREYMHVKHGRNLEDYLARFETTLALMQDAEAIERIAYELSADAAAQNVRYMEVRFSPELNAREELSPEEALEAALAGMRRAEAEHGIRTNAIICGLRTLSPEISMELAELAVAYRDRGVVAFDLAGGESGYPASRHAGAFYRVARANMASTVHAGEAWGPESIRQALHDCLANRVGHGTRLYEDAGLMQYVNDFRIPIEVCITSNVQTRAVESADRHPVRLYYDEGLVVSLNTDNWLMSGTTPTDEFLVAHQALGFTWEELCDIALMGFESAFLPYQEKRALVEEVQEEIAGLADGAV